MCAHSRMPQPEGKGAWSGNCANPLNKMSFLEKGVDDFTGRL